MATSSKDWLIFKCPSCSGMLKISATTSAKAIRCPKCKKAVKLPKSEPAPEPIQEPEPEPQPEPELEAVPDVVASDDVDTSLDELSEPEVPEASTPETEEASAKAQVEHNPDLDNWDTRRASKREVKFEGKLASTESEELQVDPNAPVDEPVRRRRRRDGADDDLGWESTRENSEKQGVGKIGKILIGLGGIALAITVILVFVNSKAQQTKVEGYIPTESPEFLAKSFDPTPFFDDITVAMSGFLNAESVFEMLQHVRDPDRVTPLATKYYADNGYAPSRVISLPSVEELLPHKKYVVGKILLTGSEPKTIALEQTPEGFKVDWESWVAYSEVSWDEFYEGKLTEPKTFRVMLGRDQYHNYEYSDQSKWTCFQIRDPGEQYRFYGYVPKNSAIERELFRALSKSTFIFVVVKLRYPDTLTRDDKQIEIVEFIEEGWVLREDNDRNPIVEKNTGIDSPLSP